MSSKHLALLASAFLALAGPVLAAGTPPDSLTLQDLVNRPDRWPASVTLPRDFVFNNGAAIHKGDKATVVQFDGAKVLLIGSGNIRFTATPADSGLLASANEAWAALTPAQRAIDPASLAADPSLWPVRVKTMTPVSYPAYGNLPPGTEVGLFDVTVKTADIVWPNSPNRLNLPFECTDVIDRARKLALIDRDSRPSRIASALRGIMVAPDGKPYNDSHLDEKKVFAIYYGAGWCAPCHEFSPDLVKYLNDALPKHPDLAAVFLSDDKQDDQMFAYMKEERMPIPAVPHGALARSPILLSYTARIIPELIIVDRFGNVLASNDDRHGNRGDPKDTIGTLDQLLAQAH